MWAIVGLGNPGPKYARTRHNAGFMVIDELASRHGLSLTERELYRATRGSIGGHSVLLMEPLTFMNLSGKAIVMGMRKFGFRPEDLIVACDDLDMDAGRIKIKSGGGTGGHNGLRSIMDLTGYKDFIRIKIGIGRHPVIPPEKYVLARMNAEDARDIEDATKLAADAIEAILSNGLEYAMNSFNKRASRE